MVIGRHTRQFKCADPREASVRRPSALVINAELICESRLVQTRKAFYMFIAHIIR